jgi:K(+)-stimulated pyrophosphate-energized sodium pump
MGIFQSNAGGAWDNAKKSFEKGVLINGEMYYKKSEPHKASVTGDTVGDPFKDTSGPSMNILIKLMSIVSLVIAPYIAQTSQITTSAINSQNINYQTENVQIIKNEDGKLIAIHKDGSAFTPKEMAAMQKAGIKCCAKPSLAERFETPAPLN